MATQFFLNDDVAAGNRFTSDSYNLDIVIDTGAMLGSTDGSALLLKNSAHDVFVRGTVFGTTAIQLGDSSTNDYANSLSISEGGAVLGELGVMAYGSAKLSNLGEIQTNWIGVQMKAAGGAQSKLNNEGIISAPQLGVYMTPEAGSGATLSNAGRIVADVYAVAMIGETGTWSRFYNTGSVEGAWAYLGGSGADRIFNRGSFTGGVDLGSGDDIFDNVGGTLTDGAVLGSGGNDVFRAGQGIEDFDGGTEVDTLDFRGSTGLRVSLVDDSGTGLAQGDSYVNFERVLGSRSGADTIIGGIEANTFLGFGGNDVLSGGGGDDQLQGGLGRDRVAGAAATTPSSSPRPRMGATSWPTSATTSGTTTASRSRPRASAAGSSRGRWSNRSSPGGTPTTMRRTATTASCSASATRRCGSTSTATARRRRRLSPISRTRRC